jgi:hypothetical protein
MSNYRYTLSLTPGTPLVAQMLVKFVVNELKTEAQWDKNNCTVQFDFDANAFLANDANDGDPLLVQRIKRAEAEIKAAMEAATAAGLSVNWVSIGPNGNRQLIADPTLIITRTY